MARALTKTDAHPEPSPADRPLRVLVISAMFPRPDNPLMGTWALDSARSLRDAGTAVRVVAPVSWVPTLAGRLAGGRARAWADTPRRHDFDGVEVVYPRWGLYQVGRLKWRAYRRPAAQTTLAWWTLRRALLREIRDFRPDVAMAQLSLMNGETARRLKAATGLPYVVLDQDCDEIEDALTMPARRRALVRVWSEAAGRLVLAERMADAAQKVWPEGDRPSVIANGSAAPPADYAPPPRPPELVGRTVVTSVGAFFPRKQRPLLVRAFARIAPDHPDAVLRLVGGGAEFEETRQLVDSLGLTGRVQLTGPLPPPRVRDELAWADTFALPSRDEPFGVVYAEAMARGLSILCGDDGGIADLVRDGVHGRIVPPRDEAAVAAALHDLLSDPAARHRMGEAGRALWRSSLTWDHHGRKLLGVLRDAATA